MDQKDWIRETQNNVGTWCRGKLQAALAVHKKVIVEPTWLYKNYTTGEMVELPTEDARDFSREMVKIIERELRGGVNERENDLA